MSRCMRSEGYFLSSVVYFTHIDTLSDDVNDSKTSYACCVYQGTQSEEYVVVFSMFLNRRRYHKVSIHCKKYGVHNTPHMVC